MLAVSIAGFEAHPEIWLMVAAIAGLGIYAVRVIGPKAVPEGEPVVTGRQKLYFWAGLLLLWIAADYPVHEIGEQQLYSVHMLQHLAFTFFVPPLFLMATPRWLVDLVMTPGRVVDRWFRRLALPVVAGVLFNFVQALTHWEKVVELSVENGLFHYLVHLLVFTTALLMWVPVVGPFRELQLSPFGKCIYLFLMSVIPTIPAAWLTFAENPVYDVYDHPDRLWGVSVADDQQAAGMVMKILGGFYLWAVIAGIFFRWSVDQRKQDVIDRERYREERERTLDRPDESDDALTFADIEARFEDVPPPADRVP